MLPCLDLGVLISGFGAAGFYLQLQQTVLGEKQMQQLSFFATEATEKMKRGSEGQRIPGTGSRPSHQRTGIATEGL